MTGTAFLIEAFGCDPDRLRSQSALAQLFGEVVRALDLHPIGDAIWHSFPGAGGVTGMWMLTESHLAVHTFPEHRSLALDVFCCRPRQGELRAALVRAVGATFVSERVLDRPLVSDDDAAA